MKLKRSRLYIPLLSATLVAFSCILLAQTDNYQSSPATEVLELADTTENIAETPSELSYQDKLRHRLDSLCTGELFLESQLGLLVYDLDENRILYALGERQLLRPASTMKLLTAITALDLLTPNYRYHTAVYSTGHSSPTTLYGNIYIKGTMDPTLDDADVDALAEGVASLHIDTIRGNIVADRSFMDSPPLGRGWCWDDDNPRLTPLLYHRQDNLAEVLLQKLHDLGIVVIPTTTEEASSDVITLGTTPKDATLLAQRYTLLSTVLERMLKMSDNLYAESVLYQIGAYAGRTDAGAIQLRLPATAEKAQMYEEQLLRECGLVPERYSLADGSGLSLYNYLSAECLVGLLRFAYHDFHIYPTLLPLLPCAGVDGTLRKRMKGTRAAGNVHAKTGTLTGVSSLAGYCTSPEGHTLAFAIMNQGMLQGYLGREFQDRVCNALCQP